VKNCFPSSKDRQLWRIDHLKHAYYLLVVSPDRPDFRHLSNQYGWSEQKYNDEILDYSKLFDRLKNGQVWRFRLAANPTRLSPPPADKISDLESKRKNNNRSLWKVMGERTAHYQAQWLIRQSDKHGFKLMKVVDTAGEDPHSPSPLEQSTLSETQYAFRITNRDRLVFNKRNDERTNRVTLDVATFEGVLKITDLSAFKRALINGIGRGKAYGCGMLTVARFE
jgi:CRISPR system Cascade subunit CasE